LAALIGRSRLATNGSDPWRRLFAAACASAIVVSGCSPERLLNRVSGEPEVVVSPDATALHRSSVVVDLHADSLLWGRDLARRSDVGHVDLPRLREGNVAIQMLTIVTHVPMWLDIERTDERWPDLITLLAIVNGWPFRTLSSRLERAVFQLERFDRLAAADGRLRAVRSRRDLDELLAAREADPRWIGVLLGIEGAQALDGDPENLAGLADRGLRMVGLAHFFDNDFAGSAHGRAKRGLTDAGRRLVREAERLGVLIDLAHSSSATIADVLAWAKKPPIVSHTGVRGTCDNPRNLSDDQLRAIAGAGGVVGIGFWETAVCGLSAADVARAVRYTVDLVGDRHVALGSDFDGAVKTPFDASRLAELTDALLASGLPEASIRRVLGENAVRLFADVLPRETPRVPESSSEAG